MAGRFDHGTEMTVDGSAVGGLLDIPLPAASIEEIESTDMDSGGVREYLAGLEDPGTMEFQCRYIPGDVGQAALVTARGTGATVAVVINLPDPATGAPGAGEPTFSFNAIVIGDSRPELFWEGSTSMRSFTLRVSGAVTEGTQPA